MSLSSIKQTLLANEMEKLGIQEADLIEKFILGSGKGGQKVNKTSSCVYLKHIPSSIEIKCQQSRSRELNRYYARKELCEKIRARDFKEKSLKQIEISKIRRQKKRRSRRMQEKNLFEKKHRSQIKNLRKNKET